MADRESLYNPVWGVSRRENLSTAPLWGVSRRENLSTAPLWGVVLRTIFSVYVDWCSSFFGFANPLFCLSALWFTGIQCKPTPNTVGT